MKWSTIMPAVEALVGQLAGIPVVWRGKAQPMVSPTAQARIELHIFGTTAMGRDDLRTETVVDQATGFTSVVFTASGNRKFTLVVRAESWRQDDHAAREYVERIRTRLQWPSSDDALQAVNCALVECAAMADFDGPFDGRQSSVSQMDVVISYGEEDRDSDNPCETIDHVQMTSQINGADGEPLPDAMQMDHVTIPPLE